MAEPIELCYRQLGLRIEAIRKALGLTQDDLAKKIDITRTSIVNIEAGRQRVMMHTVEQIASAMATTPRNLMKGIWC